jgi:AraC family transcriptional regulator
MILKRQGSEAGRIVPMDSRLPACSFHGTVLKVAELSGLRITEISYSPNLQIPHHSHENLYIGVTLKGYSNQRCESTIRTSKPWTVIFHQAGEAHSDHFGNAGAREYNVELAASKLALVTEYGPVPSCLVDFSGGKGRWLAARLYSEFRGMDDCSWLAIEGLTLELIAEILRSRLHPLRIMSPPWLKRVTDVLHDRYRDRISLGELADAAGVHPSHLAREFHRRNGCTIGQKLRRLRIEYACQLLSEGKQPLADVALAVGFSDQCQFAKTFKSVVGISPGQYRRLKFLR